MNFITKANELVATDRFGFCKFNTLKLVARNVLFLKNV